MEENELKLQLEMAYGEFGNQFRTAVEKMKKAIVNRDYEAFVSVFKELDNPNVKIPAKESFDTIDPEQFGQAMSFVQNDMFPKISESKFVMVKSNATSAAYYIQTYLDDPNYITINMIKFQKGGEKWKCTGKFYGSSLKKKPTEKENDEAIRKALETDQEFKL